MRGAHCLLEINVGSVYDAVYTYVCSTVYLNLLAGGMAVQLHILFSFHHRNLGIRQIISAPTPSLGQTRDLCTAETNCYTHQARINQGRRNRSGRSGCCRTNNLTNTNFYVHIISTFVNVN